MVRKLHILEPLNCLRDLLKASTEFATFLGLSEVEETAQEAAVKYGYATDATAKAVIATVELESTSTSTNNFETTTGLLLRLERETPTDETGTIEEEYKSFLGACEGVIDGLREDTAGQIDQLNIRAVRLGNPPQIVDADDNTEADRNLWRGDFILEVQG